MEREQMKIRIDELVSNLACCDRDACRCWQAVSDLKAIAEYALAEVEKHGPRVGIEKESK